MKNINEWKRCENRGMNVVQGIPYLPECKLTYQKQNAC
jgi:hypothetical protein